MRARRRTDGERHGSVYGVLHLPGRAFFFLCSRAKRGVDVVLIAFLRCLRAFVWKHRVVHPFLMAGQDGFAHRLSSLLYGEGVEGSFFSLSLSRCARMRAGDWFGVFWRGEEE